MTRLSRGERVFEVLNYVGLTLLSLAFLIPFLSMIATSLTGRSEIVTRGMFILYPYNPVSSAYEMLLGQGSIVINAFKVSLARVFVGTTLNVLFTFVLAYVLSRRGLRGRTPITLFVFFTMLFSGGLVPNFVLVENLGLVNSFWAMILPGLINPWWMLIMRNFIMMAIPEELEEAAMVDGATPPRILASIVFPLSMPVIATVGLWYAVWHWNAWFDAVIYLNEAWRLPLQPILRQILETGGGMVKDDSAFAAALELAEPPPAEALRAAMIVIVTTPILVVYPFIQRYFVKGVMLGGIKG